MGRKISAIKAQQKHPQRVNIYLEGEFAFSARRIVAAWLKVGQELDEEKITILRNEDEKEEAFQSALKILAHRPHSEAEIRKHLRERNFADEHIEATVDRLKESQLLDDAQFTHAWVENRSEFRPRGRKALAFELRHRGVDGQIIDRELETLDDETLAYQAGSKYARRLSGMEWGIFRQKLSGFLARRGFGYDTVSTVVRRIWLEQTGMTSERETSFLKTDYHG
jgi:regulatory protein